MPSWGVASSRQPSCSCFYAVRRAKERDGRMTPSRAETCPCLGSPRDRQLPARDPDCGERPSPAERSPGWLRRC